MERVAALAPKRPVPKRRNAAPRIISKSTITVSSENLTG